MECLKIIIAIIIVYRITYAVKCPTGCQCNSNEFSISVSCFREPYYVTDIPIMPQNTTYLEIKECDVPKLTDDIFHRNGGEDLYQIELNDNGLQFISQNAFRSLKKLLTLNIAYSSLQSLTGSEFSHLFNLLSLNIVKSHLQEIPQQSMCNTKHVKKVYLSNNEIKHLAFDQCFQFLKDLDHLDVSNNPLGNILHIAFFPMRDVGLSELILDDCNLQDLEDNLFMYLTHLKTLSLRNNKLEKLPRLPSGLSTLQVSGNKLKVIDGEVYGKLHFLKSLQIDHIGITSAKFGNGFKNVFKLTSLTMRHNVLKQLLKVDFINLGFTQIETLMIDYCHIKIIEAGTFVKFQYMKYLSLSGNGLTAKALEIGLNMVPWKNLEKVNLAWNALADINQNIFQM